MLFKNEYHMYVQALTQLFLLPRNGQLCHNSQLHKHTFLGRDLYINRKSNIKSIAVLATVHLKICVQCEHIVKTIRSNTGLGVFADFLLEEVRFSAQRNHVHKFERVGRFIDLKNNKDDKC